MTIHADIQVVDDSSHTIFGQRLLYHHHQAYQFEFDPPVSCKHRNDSELFQETKQWLIDYRLNNYIYTDLYIESLLGEYKAHVSSESIHAFIDSKEITIEEQSYIFSTVTDIRRFHQFLQSTTGVKYWNFFIDSMRILQSRYSSRFNRIDNSHLNFIHKYYSQQNEFRSIMIDGKKSSMPDSTTSDTVWFQMAMNAVHQLRTYWLPRYISEVPSMMRWKIKSALAPMTATVDNVDKDTPPSNLQSHTEEIFDRVNFVKVTLDNISYIDHSPQQSLLIDSSKQHDFEEDNEVLNTFNNHHQTKPDDRIEPEQRPSVQSIEDYATEHNFELFYRIFVSDSLAGGPFLHHLSLTSSKDEATSLQTCLHFITDAEVVLSAPSGNFKTRILKQFISRYLTISTIDQLPIQLFDNFHEQRTEFIDNLLTENTDKGSLFWKTRFKITKILVPHFLKYIKFDRLRFLLQNNTANTNNLPHCIPSINFEKLRVGQQTPSKQRDSDEVPFISQIDGKNCGIQLNDLLKPLNERQYHTAEKLINTDEICEFPPRKRLRPMITNELKPESRQLCTASHWTTVLVNESKSPDPIEQTSIETLIHPDMMQIDRYVSNLMNESLHLYEINRTFEVEKRPSLMNSINMHVFLKHDRKFLSSNGFYFINPPNNSIDPSISAYLYSNRSRFLSQFTLHHQSHTSPTSFSGFVKDFTIDDSGIGHLSCNLKQTDRLKLSTKIKLYTDDHREFLLANVQSYTIDSHAQQLHLFLDQFTLPNITKPSALKQTHDAFHESLYLAPQDKCNDVKISIASNQTSPFSIDDQNQLLTFIQSELIHQTWPAQEYLGIKQQRTWRAFQLAAEVSSFDSRLALNYHHDVDWISTDYDLGSFDERTHTIQQKFTNSSTDNIDSCCNQYY
ncbi:unnamed protein product [Adineta ricciae]|uniref:Uncharacterized protein n=1 Tax=Adineta ricciae TaxID=249248 RepID=A0A814QE07_ADIRI|nr:unnamed protein product [Adineta ricciae]